MLSFYHHCGTVFVWLCFSILCFSVLLSKSKELEIKFLANQMLFQCSRGMKEWDCNVIKNTFYILLLWIFLFMTNKLSDKAYSWVKIKWTISSAVLEYWNQIRVEKVGCKSLSVLPVPWHNKLILFSWQILEPIQ